MSDQRPKHNRSKPDRVTIPLDASVEQLQKLIDEWKRMYRDDHPELSEEEPDDKQNQKKKDDHISGSTPSPAS